MERQIKKLVKLAAEIRDWGKDFMPSTWTTISRNEAVKIGVYYAQDDRDSNAVDFHIGTDEVQVLFYKDAIDLPMSATAESIASLVKAAKETFIRVREVKEEEFREQALEDRLAKAEKMKAEFESLGYTVEKKA